MSATKSAPARASCAQLDASSCCRAPSTASVSLQRLGASRLTSPSTATGVLVGVLASRSTTRRTTRRTTRLCASSRTWSPVGHSGGALHRRTTGTESRPWGCAAALAASATPASPVASDSDIRIVVLQSASANRANLCSPIHRSSWSGEGGGSSRSSHDFRRQDVLTLPDAWPGFGRRPRTSRPSSKTASHSRSLRRVARNVERCPSRPKRESGAENATGLGAGTGADVAKGHDCQRPYPAATMLAWTASSVATDALPEVITPS
jgi:hypothetical protein